MDYFIGDWVIDTKRKSVVTLCGVIPGCCPEVFVVSDDDEYYLQSEENIIPYDKYWFDNN